MKADSLFRKTPQAVIPSLITMIFLCSMIPSFSQGMMQNKSPEKNHGSTVSFYETQKQFNEHWKGRTVTKGSGYNVFRRWEWYWEPRVNTDGSFPPNNVLYSEWERWSAEHATDAGHGNWTSMGPEEPIDRYFGLGRVNCIAFHPTIINTFWVGTPSGGIWRTDDFGYSWTSLLEGQPVLGVSDIVVDWKDPMTLYIATGDYDGGGSISSINNTGSGDTKSIGILKSVNGGQSWQKTGFGLEVSAEKRISRLVQDPVNSKVLYTTTTEGIFKTVNGGLQWDTLVPDTGNLRDYCDIAFKPGNSQVVYAASRTNQKIYSCIYRSTDGGQNWEVVKRFSATDNVFRIKLAVSVQEPNILEAVTVNKDGGFRSLIRFDFSGSPFTTEIVDALRQDCKNNYLNSSFPVASDPCIGQGDYDLTYAIDPVNKDVRYLGGVNLMKSTDRGKTFSLANYWYEPDPNKKYEMAHADKHGFAFHPLQQGTMFECNDGGVLYSRNGGKNWTDISKGIAVAQIYRIAGSWEDDGLLLAGFQDNGSQVKGYPPPRKGWWSTNVIGGDGMACLIDWSDPLIRYVAYLNGDIKRTLKGDWSDNYNISNYIPGAKSGAWVTPYVINPVNPEVLYAGYDKIWRTGKRGDSASWSPLMKVPYVKDDTIIRNLVIAEHDTSVMWASTVGKIFKTSNAWKTWDSIPRTKLAPLAKGYFPTGFAIHPTKPNTVYVTFSTFDTTNMKVYRTEDGGNNWTNITGNGLPKVPVNCIAYEASANNALYIGTDLGVYYKNDSLPDWIPFNNYLPNVIVTDLTIAYGIGKIRAATFGRGLWESDLYVPSGKYKVNVKDVPKQGGDVSGGGIYSAGTKARVSATVEPGYRFKGWFENGTKKSDSLNYEFDVTENHNLIAEFQYPQSTEFKLKEKIRVSPNPCAGLLNLGMDEETRKNLETVRVITYSGTLVWESENLPAENALQVDLRRCPDGMYLLTLYFRSGEHLTYPVMVRR